MLSSFDSSWRWYRDANSLGEEPQQIALPLGELDRLLVAFQLSPRQAENAATHADFVTGRAWRLAAAQNVAQPQQQLTRLERFGDVIIDAGFETGDAIFGIGERRQHADRYGPRRLEIARQRQTAFARHHDVEQHEIERQSAHE